VSYAVSTRFCISGAGLGWGLLDGQRGDTHTRHAEAFYAVDAGLIIDTCSCVGRWTHLDSAVWARRLH
jgi:hypothetical protein